ncbi:cation diffusion facilitator family transporter [Aestuariibacter halophilus]|uniref:Cation diffusion facilitator family transporter n=1 Tax=Fluctibacter halophilus TaxID=226011 RepID=A0ABS8G818_9ALTE|nr:cation diffusion facilitator family transporter [Aestuariibacter halophilus]MCC2616236.1 cation diffusion facilitator family transporter [Aestuariibacter halophilus]
MSSCCAPSAEDQQQRRLLWTVLVLNGGMFFVEFVAGWLAQSSGLMADSLDMLADAFVYGLSLYAVGKAAHFKARAALVNGSLQWALGALILIDIAHKILTGAQPDVSIMISIAVLALVVNVACFGLLWRHRKGDINMRASWICSRNDMLANAGVLVSAGIVSYTGQAWADWLIGCLIALTILVSATRIIRDARAEKVSSCCG